MIYFVGAGPGATDLITVRGMRLLEEADVIIYTGSLVNQAILKYAKKDPKIYNSAGMTLEEVMDVMLTEDRPDRTIVRLHTGEPSLYGAVREQMDILDEKGVRYSSCPGVSACFAAAASLDMEYTLPGVSQSLIITRMAGRTEVPDSESIESFASHHASLAVYLSAGMLDELSKRLISGGYDKDTAAAIVYKASHPDEIKVVCTVGTLAKTAEKYGINKTAVILVGDAVKHAAYERSKLYDPEFETGFRKAVKSRKTSESSLANIDIFCFTENGKEIAGRLNAAFERSAKNRADVHMNISDELVRECFSKRHSLIFIGAAGIAVRAISGFVKDKLTDSPVIVIDDRGRFVIPILSGHVGGANALAFETAEKIGAIPVITTSTDINDAFSADVFAAENNLKIANRDGIKDVSVKALAKKPVTISIKDYPPEEMVDITISNDENANSLLRLVPKKYVLGLGMKKGKDAAKAEEFVLSVLRVNGIGIADIEAIATIDAKEDEEAVRYLSEKYRIPVIAFENTVLERVAGNFSSSDFVKETVGVGNVCERAAVLAAGRGGKLIVKKQKGEGITAALAEKGCKTLF